MSRMADLDIEDRDKELEKQIIIMEWCMDYGFPSVLSIEWTTEQKVLFELVWGK